MVHTSIFVKFIYSQNNHVLLNIVYASTSYNINKIVHVQTN